MRISIILFTSGSIIKVFFGDKFPHDHFLIGLGERSLIESEDGGNMEAFEELS